MCCRLVRLPLHPLSGLQRGVHVINLSFGEYSKVDNYGRFISMAELAVHKHGIIFITSAGNNGPALTTGGCAYSCWLPH